MPASQGPRAYREGPLGKDKRSIKPCQGTTLWDSESWEVAFTRVAGVVDDCDAEYYGVMISSRVAELQLAS